MKFKLLLLSLFIFLNAIGQSITKRTLFLGNSYTAVNNLPQMVADAATSTSDVFIFDSNTPGGYTLQGHTSNATSLAKIALGSWDYVVLQEQSQRPSFEISQVQVEVFPYAQSLNNTIVAQNPCAETVFYMTWGRKNGDASNCASYPPLCTYEGMDDLLNLRYMMMADDNDAIVSPVGAVWRHIRQNYPLLELYQSDESHPSVAGTYAAACSFYTVLFRKDPTLITFNSTLSAIDAANIRAATKLIVFDNLSNWHVGDYDPLANFSYTHLGGGQVSFTNTATNASDYIWNFGDGTTSTDSNPTHTFTTTGVFNVQLSANKCNMQNSSMQTINITTLGVQTNEIDANTLTIYPNPVKDRITLKVDAILVGVKYVIYDNLGRSVLTGKINSETSNIELKQLTKGIYLFSLEEHLKQPLRIIKE
jgi:hypothetical protein